MQSQIRIIDEERWKGLEGLEYELRLMSLFRHTGRRPNELMDYVS